MGCVVHSHLDPFCPFNKNANENSKNPYGKTFKIVNEEFYKKNGKFTYKS